MLSLQLARKDRSWRTADANRARAARPPQEDRGAVRRRRHAGERDAAEAALERIRARLRSAEQTAEPVGMQFSLGDPWTRQLFVALARRYGLRPYRLDRQRRTRVMLRAPEPFIREVLWPEFEQLSAALTGYLTEVTERIIREEVHGETGVAEERPEPGRLP